MNDVLKGFLIALGVVGCLLTMGFFFVLNSLSFAEQMCFDPGLQDLSPVLVGDVCYFGDSSAKFLYSITCDGSMVQWYSDTDVIERSLGVELEDCFYYKTVLENFK